MAQRPGTVGEVTLSEQRPIRQCILKGSNGTEYKKGAYQVADEYRRVNYVLSGTSSFVYPLFILQLPELFYVGEGTGAVESGARGSSPVL